MRLIAFFMTLVFTASAGETFKTKDGRILVFGHLREAVRAIQNGQVKEVEKLYDGTFRVKLAAFRGDGNQQYYQYLGLTEVIVEPGKSLKARDTIGYVSSDDYLRSTLRLRLFDKDGKVVMPPKEIPRVEHYGRLGRMSFYRFCSACHEGTVLAGPNLDNWLATERQKDHEEADREFKQMILGHYGLSKRIDQRSLLEVLIYFNIK